MARSTRSLAFSGSKILVVLDLPQEVLLKRRGMKPITDQLKSKGIRFRWSSSSDVVVVKDGAQYKAEDLASGRTLLAALEISLPSECSPSNPIGKAFACVFNYTYSADGTRVFFTIGGTFWQLFGHGFSACLKYEKTCFFFILFCNCM